MELKNKHHQVRLVLISCDFGSFVGSLETWLLGRFVLSSGLFSKATDISRVLRGVFFIALVQKS